jgi:putative ABC transport system ATP-binding protein
MMFDVTRSVLVQTKGLEKTYSLGEVPFRALAGVDFTAGKGEFVAILGKSGSGKSTLLNLITGTDEPTAGTVEVAGTDITKLSQGELARFRATQVGLVFQFRQLLPTLTAAENVMLPAEFARIGTPASRRARALELLDRLEVADQADKVPASLSGGQQQRAAIARALMNEPSLVAADEPTGNLDSATADHTLSLFRALADAGTTVLMVTHERDVSAWADRTVTITDGNISGTTLETKRA